MTLGELSNLKRALDLMGLDIGASPVTNAIIPAEWEMRCQVADAELATLSADELTAFTQGEETEMNEVAKKAPSAHEVLNASFDDDLSEVFFDPWRNIFDARDAENRVANS